MSENMEKVYDVIVVGSGLRGLRRHCTAPRGLRDTGAGKIYPRRSNGDLE